MTRTRTCIYCLEDKTDERFDREHVIPQAFGVFQNNLVLESVCIECNTYFGRELDLKLARDAPEAHLRVKHGLKRASEFRSLGKRATTYGEITAQGPLKGARMMFVSNPDPDGDL